MSSLAKAQIKDTQAECRMGNLLGKGASASVFAVSVRQPNKGFSSGRTYATTDETTSVTSMSSEDDTLGELGSTVFERPPVTKACVVKKIRASIKVGRKDLVRELSAEALTLSKIPAHKHIIEMVGTSCNIENAQSQDDSAFLILERLDETLEKRLNRLAAKSKALAANNKKAGLRKRIFARKEMKKQELAQCQVEQARNMQHTGALGIAKALRHLHKNQIIYRDLKPANVGFDADGTVKIFDFGLSSQLKPGAKVKGFAGTPRYMANEIMAGKRAYGFSVDVYSFGLLLWQCATLQKPFGHCKNLVSLRDAVLVENFRPSLDEIAIPELKPLLAACWSADPSARPTFDEVEPQLEAILASYC